MNTHELTVLVSSFVIGDGSLRCEDKNAGYSCKQIIKHKDYILWQARVLENITPVRVVEKDGYVDKNGVNHQPTISVQTRRHPFFTTLYNRNYFSGRKTVSIHDVKNFDWRSLANWYMDDGYILRASDVSQRGGVFLCTDNFNHAEVLMLQKLLYTNFELPFSLRKRGFTYRLHLTPKNSKKFIDGVTPYIFDSFKYKLHTEGTV